MTEIVTSGSIEEQLAAVDWQIAIARAQQDVTALAQWLMPDPDYPDDPNKSLYQIGKHHRLLGNALNALIEGSIPRLAISMPPQHGKSEIASRIFPCSYLGRWPHRNYMFGTYSQDFANVFGDDVRTYLESERYKEAFPNTRLRGGSRAKDFMVTTNGGKLSFLGRGGAGTGKSADHFTIDDPIKDAKEASSLTIRNDVWNWFTKVANTRMHKMSTALVIQTRWHEDDLIGRLTDKRNPYYDPVVAAQWTVINIPFLFEPIDAAIAKELGKMVGDILWPERFSIEQGETMKRMDPQGFSALYQGRPIPPEGVFFKREDMHYYELAELPDRSRWVAYGACDLAVGEEKRHDSTVVGTWIIDDQPCAYLLPSIYWEKKKADSSVEYIVATGKENRWRELAGESGQIEKAIGPFLKTIMKDRGAYFNLETLPTVGDKGARALSIRGLMREGRIKFPRFAKWWTSAEEQMLSFTGIGDDREDDFVDMCAIFGQRFAKLYGGMSFEPIKKSGNVIKVGTFAWIKQQTAYKEREQKLSRAIRGW